MTKRLISALLLPLALAACGEEPTPVVTPSRRPPPVRPPVLRKVPHTPPPALRVQNGPGLQGVIGMTEAELSHQFGPPRLDVVEGDARKLQYAGSACVMDIYLYPAKTGGAPRSTYVETRRATDAQEVDRTACIAALRKR